MGQYGLKGVFGPKTPVLINKKVIDNGDTPLANPPFQAKFCRQQGVTVLRDTPHLGASCRLEFDGFPQTPTYTIMLTNTTNVIHGR